MPRYSNRWGRFTIDHKAIFVAWTAENESGELLDNPAIRGLMACFARMIVICAHDSPHSASVTYWAISPDFGEIEEGVRPPWYRWQWLVGEDGEITDVKAVRLEGVDAQLAENAGGC